MSLNETVIPTNATGLSGSIQHALNISPVSAEVLASIVLLVGSAAIGWAVYFVFNRFFSKWAEKTETTLDDDIIDAVKSFIVIIVVILGIEYALAPLSFLQGYMEMLNHVFLAIEIFLIAFAITRVSNIVADWYGDRHSEKGKSNRHMMFIIKKSYTNNRIHRRLYRNNFLNNQNYQQRPFSFGT